MLEASLEARVVADTAAGRPAGSVYKSPIADTAGGRAAGASHRAFARPPLSPPDAAAAWPT